jgi:hypothetical protein
VPRPPVVWTLELRRFRRRSGQDRRPPSLDVVSKPSGYCMFFWDLAGLVQVQYCGAPFRVIVVLTSSDTRYRTHCASLCACRRLVRPNEPRTRGAVHGKGRRSSPDDECRGACLAAANEQAPRTSHRSGCQGHRWLGLKISSHSSLLSHPLPCRFLSLSSRTTSYFKKSPSSLATWTRVPVGICGTVNRSGGRFIPLVLLAPSQPAYRGSAAMGRDLTLLDVRSVVGRPSVRPLCFVCSFAAAVAPKLAIAP